MGMLPTTGQGYVGSMPRVPLIAIVDNDDALRESLDNLLRSVGWRTQGFASAEALARSALHRNLEAVLDRWRHSGRLQKLFNKWLKFHVE